METTGRREKSSNSNVIKRKKDVYLRPALKGRQNSVPAGLTDPDILSKAQQGDVPAFEALYCQHKIRVYRLCLRMVRNEALAEDLMQETFLQVYRKLHTFRREAAFTTWLHRVTTNTVFMYLRKRRLPVISMQELEQSPAEDNTIREPGREDPALRSCADRLTFQAAVAGMPNGYRTILSLHDILGYHHPEIARKLSCSVGNSKSQLHKARMRLRSSLLRGLATDRAAA